MRRTKNVLVPEGQICLERELVGRKVGRKLCTWIAAPLIAAALSLTAEAQTIYNDIPYPSPGAVGNQCLLDLYLPNNDDGNHPPTGFTFILAHTGSYTAGDKSELDDIGAALANRGFAAISINYTLAQNSYPGPGPGIFPQPILDVLNAVRWVRTTGTQVDLPNRVIICGFSAGSTIATPAALAAMTNTFHPLPPAANRGYAIDGVIGCFGRYDLMWNGPLGYPLTLANYLGAFYNSPNVLSVWPQASAMTYAQNCSPPTVLFHGDSDQTVPVGNSLHLAAALQQAGAPVSLHVIPGGTHSFDILGATAYTQAATLASAAAWIDVHPSCNSVNAPPPPPPPPPSGRCCAPTGACAVTIEANCPGTWTALMVSGVSIGASVPGVCTPNPCQAPPTFGACCQGASCVVALPTDCSVAGTSFIGAGNACNPFGDHRHPCCQGDFDQNGHTEVQDIFTFLNGWFHGDADAILNSGSTIPTVQDIFDFLGAWFGGC